MEAPKKPLKSTMNLPNQLTLGRLVLTLIFVFCLSAPIPFGITIALVLFCVAGITDYVDGVLARRWGLITNFGKLMDPLIDKIMIASGFVCLIPFGAVPAWAAIIIVSREFLVTGLRLLAGSRGLVLPAESLGKHKTTWQIVTVIFFLVMLSVDELGWGGVGMPWWDGLWQWGGGILLVLALGFTLISGLGYFWKHRLIVLQE